MAAIQQNRLSFPAGGIQHEIRPASAKRFRCLVDQRFFAFCWREG